MALRDTMSHHAATSMFKIYGRRAGDGFIKSDDLAAVLARAVVNPGLVAPSDPATSPARHNAISISCRRSRRRELRRFKSIASR